MILDDPNREHLDPMLALLPRRMKTKPLRVALLGFGTVGGSVARILTERPELADRLQLTHIFNRGVARKRAGMGPFVGDVDRGCGRTASRRSLTRWSKWSAASTRPAAGCGGRSQQGARVVTANKQLLAAHGPELLHLAVTNHSQLRFEAAVAGGVPLIHGVREGLAGDRLTACGGHSQRHLELTC